MDSDTNSLDEPVKTKDSTRSLTRRGVLAATGALGLSTLVPGAQAHAGSQSGNGGSFPDQYYDPQTPLERDGRTIVYNGHNHPSLQAAYNELTEGDTLRITPGTYKERLRLAENYTDHITIRGVGNQVSRPTIEYPDTEEGYVLGVNLDEGWLGSEHPVDASLVGPHSGSGTGGSTESITVSDTSPFSVGDDIHVTEHRHPFGEPNWSGGFYAEDITREYRTVTGIDGDELLLDSSLVMNYPNEAPAEVGVIDFNVEDVRISNLEFVGDGLYEEGNEDELDDVGVPGYEQSLLRFQGMKEVLLDDILCRDTGHGEAIRIDQCYRTRGTGLEYERVNRYGLSAANNATTTLVTDTEHRGGSSSSRYIVRFGNGAVEGFVRNGRGKNLGRTTADTHLGGWYTTFEDLQSDDNGTTTVRSVGMTVDGFSEERSPGPSIIVAQAPDRCAVKNGEITDKQGNVVFRIKTGLDSRDYDTGGSITFENIEIDAYDGRGPEDIGTFTDEGAEFEGTLTFRNVTYGGEPLQRTHVEQWDNYGIATIGQLVVE